MNKLLVTRSAGMLITLLLLMLIVVLFARLVPGDAIDVRLGDQRADPAARKQLEAELGLDRSVPEAYADYVLRAVRGDFGRSLLSGRDVRSLIADRLLVTVELAGFALILGVLVGTTIGIISAVKRGGILDYLLRSVAIFGLTVPNFALATAAIVLPAIYLHWTPPLSYRPFSEGAAAHFGQFVVPGIILAVNLMGSQMRVMRTQMLEVLAQDYVRTAHAKGLTGGKVVLGHALRNALIPVISVLGLQVAVILSGSIIIEQLFGLPGMGTLLIQGVNTKDWPVVQGVTFAVGVWVVLVNLLVDLSYGVLDPRVRLHGGSSS